MAIDEINLSRLRVLRSDARIDFAKELYAFFKSEVAGSFLEKYEVVMHVFPDFTSKLSFMSEAEQQICSIDLTCKTLQELIDIFTANVFNGAVDHPDIVVFRDSDLRSVFGEDPELGKDNMEAVVAMLVFGHNAGQRHDALKYEFEPNGLKM